jgi:hypothetical protein
LENEKGGAELRANVFHKFLFTRVLRRTKRKVSEDLWDEIPGSRFHAQRNFKKAPSTKVIANSNAKK